MLTTAEKIKVIMKRNNFTMTELANQLNCSRQNLSNKMSRNNFDERELTAIANALGYELEINFINRETGEKMSQFQVLCKPSLWCRIEIH